MGELTSEMYTPGPTPGRCCMGVACEVRYTRCPAMGGSTEASPMPNGGGM